MIQFRDGYRYQLAENYSCATPFRPPERTTGAYRTLFPTGRIVIRKGYSWDGPSGPSVDTPSFMRGSLVHDALYQFLREGRRLHEPHPGEVMPVPGPQAWDTDTWRYWADRLLHEHCLEDGMSRIRAWWVLRAVRRFAGDAASAASIKEVQTAP